MKPITVPKDKLLTALQENREEHKRIYDEALEEYPKRAVAELRERARQIAKGDKVNLFFNLPRPEEHLADYDRAIAMVQWEIAENIVLEERDFNRFVLNQWDWINNFAANTTSYSSASGAH